MPKKHSNPLNNDSILSQLEGWEGFIWQNIEKFEEEFCYSHQLVDVYFSSAWMRIVWLTEEGMSISNTLPINKLLAFINKNKSGKNKIQDS